MAEVIVVFTVPIVAEDDRSYDAQACGRRVGRIWEGWIEFAAADGEVLRTARETTQQSRIALQVWANNLSFSYLEDALSRARALAAAGDAAMVATPHFEGPAPTVGTPTPVVKSRVAVLDPYTAAEKGEAFLRQKLSALRASHLRNIVRAYDFADDSVNLPTLTESELIELIVAKVMLPV